MDQPLVNGAVPYDAPRMANDDAAQFFAFQQQRGEKHLQTGEQCDRKQAVDHRRAGILDRNCRNVGNHNGGDQLGWLKLSDLAFSHKPKRAGDRDKENHRPPEGDQHETAPFLKDRLHFCAAFQKISCPKNFCFIPLIRLAAHILIPLTAAEKRKICHSKTRKLFAIFLPFPAACRFDAGASGR